jgi:hypothetical protein
MKTILATTPYRVRITSGVESRLIFWNLVLTLVLSSGLLIVYLKRILFDF